MLVSGEADERREPPARRMLTFGRNLQMAAKQYLASRFPLDLFALRRDRQGPSDGQSFCLSSCLGTEGSLYLFQAESITEGTLKQWSKQVGDFVNQDEEIATIETDKVCCDGKGQASKFILSSSDRCLCQRSHVGKDRRAFGQ